MIEGPLRDGDNSRDAVVLRKCMAAGVCAACHSPKEEGRARFYFCTGCHDGQRKPKLYAIGARRYRVKTGYEARIACLKCGRPFQSADRRKVRNCDKCRDWLGYQADQLGIGGEWAV